MRDDSVKTNYSAMQMNIYLNCFPLVTQRFESFGLTDPYYSSRFVHSVKKNSPRYFVLLCSIESEKDMNWCVSFYYTPKCDVICHITHQARQGF